MRYFLTLTERAAIIEEAVQADCQTRDDLDPVSYRAELESMNNYDLIQVCCNV